MASVDNARIGATSDPFRAGRWAGPARRSRSVALAARGCYARRAKLTGG